MSVSQIFIDLTLLVQHPIHSGIQRVEREIINHWSGPADLIACRFDHETESFVELPDQVLQEIKDGRSEEEERDRLMPLLTGKGPISNHDLIGGLFNVEVHYHPTRLNAYRTLCRAPHSRVAWLVYDFIPFLQPQFWPCRTTETLMHYIRTLQEVPRVSFISEATRTEYIEKIVRAPERAGPAFPLGGDGYAMPKLQFDNRKRMFSFIGSIEPRKNVAAIMLAFESLWDSGVEAPLTIVGRSDVYAPVEMAILKRIAGRPLFRHFDHATDAVVAEVLENSRATIFVSSAEGFGIPPYESLIAGVPVIASKGIPSLDLLPPSGRLTIDDIRPETIANAVRHMLKDQAAESLWGEAAGIEIPTWRDFGQKIASWVQE
ncbi:glycosyltransferase [Rhizobium calliandrae]|uniref:Glycosyltransferase n=1 Tax=Rhizobium calliandrae TaxID=1312182 RepID=A0ABT7KQ90_9HYPH|nr:glycosyltransferase [Rhizobium calliandrae]MDL2410790.1 glycosyltransferase [Rhizobium calliandrae]